MHQVRDSHFGWHATTTNEGTDHIRIDNDGDGFTTAETTWDVPSCTVTWPTTDKTGQAFKVAKQLIEKKIVKATSIKQFTELVDAIAKEL